MGQDWFVSPDTNTTGHSMPLAWCTVSTLTTRPSASSPSSSSRISSSTARVR
ncbi:MAG: hypothetical protein R3F62_21130 [Planctomycetota bacterium]